MRISNSRDAATATLLGIVTIFLWASLVAVARGVRESVGVVPSAAIANLLGGTIALSFGPAPWRRLQRLLRLSPKYLLGCGTLFVVFHLLLFSAIERAATNRQAVEIVLINYLWPALSVLAMLVILRKRASKWLGLGLLVAIFGAFEAISATPDGSVSLASFRTHIAINPWPYFFSMMAAFCWALYSTLTRRWAADVNENVAPLFLFATGVGLFVLHGVSGGALHLPLQLRVLLQLAYLTIFPTMLAYLFWDRAMRRGRIVLVMSFSFLTPVLSTTISCLYLGVPLERNLLIASGMVVAGAVICNRSVRSS